MTSSPNWNCIPFWPFVLTWKSDPLSVLRFLTVFVFFYFTSIGPMEKSSVVLLRSILVFDTLTGEIEDEM